MATQNCWPLHVHFPLEWKQAFHIEWKSKDGGNCGPSRGVVPKKNLRRNWASCSFSQSQQTNNWTGWTFCILNVCVCVCSCWSGSDPEGKIARGAHSLVTFHPNAWSPLATNYTMIYCSLVTATHIHLRYLAWVLYC